ncbi:MAG: hypothetical protein JNM57_10710 [Cyclobacteriaceae bacterium]|nr:hypothetical protein [Cyclobacteriaceae bacterium]
MMQSGTHLIACYLIATRSAIIEPLLSDVVRLRFYLQNKLSVRRVSDVKLEFVRRGMRALADSPIDLVHYSDVIMDLKRRNSLSINEEQHRLFHTEIKKAVENFLL